MTRLERSQLRVEPAGAACAANAVRQVLDLHMPEREWQAQIVAIARLNGWWVHHAWSEIHSQAGAPDLLLIRPPRVVFIECKRERERKLRPDQAAVQMLLSNCPSVETYVFRPSDWEHVCALLAR